MKIFFLILPMLNAINGFSQKNMNKKWENTGDHYIDLTVDKLNNLNNSNLSSYSYSIKNALRPLFNRAAFIYGIEEENWLYFLYAIARTNDILQYYKDFFENEEKKKLEEVIERHKKIIDSVSSIFGMSREEFNIFNKQNYRSVDFTGKNLVIVKELRQDFYDERNEDIWYVLYRLKKLNIVDIRINN